MELIGRRFLADRLYEGLFQKSGQEWQKYEIR